MEMGWQHFYGERVAKMFKSVGWKFFGGGWQNVSRVSGHKNFGGGVTKNFWGRMAQNFSG